MEFYRNNNYGQLGNSYFYIFSEPIEIKNLKDPISISAGYDFSLILEADLSVWGFGNGCYGQLGNGNFEDSNLPIKILNLYNPISISGGGYFSLAISGYKSKIYNEIYAKK